MKLSSITLAALATTMMVPFVAQSVSAADEVVRPRFEVLPMHGAGKQYKHTPSSLQTWAGSFTYESHNYSYTAVGTNPASSNTTTTITVYVIPIKMVYSRKITHKKKVTFDPMVDQQNGVSIVQNLLNSPLFNSLDWQWGTIDMGSTQYEDAWQRGSFWGNIGGANTAYHIMLAPTALTEETINVAAGQGTVETNPISHSGTIGTYGFGTMDHALQGFITKFSQVNPTNLPLFIVDNIYLTSGGCCIGGYHSAEGNGQTYSFATYISDSSSPTFSSDIDAFSHELGEWIDDPFINNTNQPCGGILEVGDPLEGKTNYGTFPVTFGGVTWHPQALVFISYFGAPASNSANSWLDNQHIESSVCENGQ